LPQNILQYEDFIKNEVDLNIEKSVRKNNKPLLIVHGEEDTSVSIQEGKDIAEWAGIELKTISKTQHTFGSSHPWEKENMPEKLEYVCKLTAEFIKALK
jgi:alpha-beta hydrolase superfamily lysophospholipase